MLRLLNVTSSLQASDMNRILEAVIKAKESFKDAAKDSSLARIKVTMIVCFNFGQWHPALTSSFTKYKFLQVKNSFATIVNGLLVLKLFQLSNGDLLFSQQACRISKVCKPRMTKLGHIVEGRVHYPTSFSSDSFGTVTWFWYVHSLL